MLLDRTEFPKNLISFLLEKWSGQILLQSLCNRLSFKELFIQSAKMSAQLNSKPGQRIFVLSRDSEFIILTLWAIWMRGSIAVPINPDFPEKRIRNMMKQCNSSLIISDDTSFQQKSDEIKILNLISRAVDFDQFEDFLWPPIQMDNPALVIFTSGSTGHPKAAVLSLGNLFFNAEGSNRLMELVPGDQWLMSIPLYHVGGLGILFRCLLSGATTVLSKPSISLEDQLKKRNFTHLSLVPTQLHRLLETTDGSRLLKKLKLILLGGAAQPSSLLEKSLRQGLKVMTSFGCTEMASQIATDQPHQFKGHWIASGRILPHREVWLADDGEILVRGKTLFLGYLDEKKKSEKNDFPGLIKSLVNGDWFATGDLGEWIISSGNPPLLRVTGRKDNQFISGGENIHPEEIESLLQEKPDIVQAVVVPVMDEDFGERPIAFLKRSESTFSTEMDIREYLANQLTVFQIPDLFLSYPHELTSLKPQRKELSRIAQPRFDAWKNVKPLRKWLLSYSLGWKEILKCNGKHIFEIRRHDLKESFTAFFSADNRKQIMDFLTRATLTELEKVAWTSYEFYGKEKKPSDSFEIIRLVKDDCTLSEINVCDITHKALPRKIHLMYLKSKPIIFDWEIQDHSGFIRKEDQKVEYGFCAPVFDHFPEKECGQAVFQTGAMLPKWKRLYLIRCLYSFDTEKRCFLGWKVQRMQNLETGIDVDHPIWKMDSEEEQLLEAVLILQNHFSLNDLEFANTPEKDRERRKHFELDLKNFNLNAT